MHCSHVVFHIPCFFFGHMPPYHASWCGCVSTLYMTCAGVAMSFLVKASPEPSFVIVSIGGFFLNGSMAIKNYIGFYRSYKYLVGLKGILKFTVKALIKYSSFGVSQLSCNHNGGLS